MTVKSSTDNGRLPGILFITSFPPRECGIATYSQDLVKSLNNQFGHSFSIRICPLESDTEKHHYKEDVKYVMNVDEPGIFDSLAERVNNDMGIQLVVIQHEFGFFEKTKDEFQLFLALLSKPVVVAFHTVLPLPGEDLKENVRKIAGLAQSIIVMTRSSARILAEDYGIQKEKVSVIPHGTHLVKHEDKEFLKRKYGLSGKKILSTFGLLSSGKSIETTLDALPAVVSGHPDVLFLVIGKTHPTVVKKEGEAYRNMLEARVVELGLLAHVQFINCFLPLQELLEYLQLTDIYLFTTHDRNQAVSGTFAYAISCGCPVISTPIPHAREVLKNDAGIIFDFENSIQLSHAITTLLDDEERRNDLGSNGLHRMASTAWENSAIAHGMLFDKITEQVNLKYNLPPVNLDHLHRMTTEFGIIQFSKINHPDINSGYTLDDNARALIAICRHFELTGSEEDLGYIRIYFDFIKFCQQPEGNFLNYVDGHRNFSAQNLTTNLEDSNGRAIWALGYLLSLAKLLPASLVSAAGSVLERALSQVDKIHSTRAMAFVIKGLYYNNLEENSGEQLGMIRKLANRLVQMYRHEGSEDWEWFESYLTYANSLLPEAMLCAWLATGDQLYKKVSKSTFDFLLSKIFTSKRIRVISNKRWLQKGARAVPGMKGGEQPIDVAYTILALKKFFDVFQDDEYFRKMEMAFNWFLGNNHLRQVIYNPCTGGCYDGLEENYVNLNQGAESTISYLLARLTMSRPSVPPIKIRDHRMGKKFTLRATDGFRFA